jgi:hypothetical protein
MKYTAQHEYVYDFTAVVHPQAKAALLLQKFDKDEDGELGLEDIKGLMRKLQKK